MDCKEAQEQFELYLLGALEPREMARTDYHVDTCPECSRKLREEGNIVTELAYAAPQIEVPPQVKRQLFSRIEAAQAPLRTPRVIRDWLRDLVGLGPKLVPHSGITVGVALVAVVVLGGIWFNSRINNIDEEKEVLATQIESVAEGGAEMIEKLKEQRYLTYMSAAPDVSVNRLSATRPAAKSRGMVMAPRTGEAPVLAALDLPPLPKDKVYQVWLIKDGLIYSGGVFTVDSTGYAQTIIPLFAPMASFNAIVITVERAGGSPGPTGESVLKGDL